MALFFSARYFYKYQEKKKIKLLFCKLIKNGQPYFLNNKLHIQKHIKIPFSVPPLGQASPTQAKHTPPFVKARFARTVTKRA
jgi:hypothetical protein